MYGGSAAATVITAAIAKTTEGTEVRCMGCAPFVKILREPRVYPVQSAAFEQRVFACDVEADVNKIELFAGKIYPEEEVKE